MQTTVVPGSGVAAATAHRAPAVLRPPVALPAGVEPALLRQAALTGGPQAPVPLTTTDQSASEVCRVLMPGN